MSLNIKEESLKEAKEVIHLIEIGKPSVNSITLTFGLVTDLWAGTAVAAICCGASKKFVGYRILESSPARIELFCEEKEETVDMTLGDLRQRDRFRFVDEDWIIGNQYEGDECIVGLTGAYQGRVYDRKVWDPNLPIQKIFGV